MSGITVPILKFVGTVSLGLLTGVSYTTSTQSVPSLFALPSAAAANATYTQHRSLTTTQLAGLSTLASSTYLLAYTLSPGRRHPYLIYVVFTVGVGAAVDLFMTKRDTLHEKERGNAEKPYVEEDDYEDINGSVRLNGEEVRRSMEGWKLRQTVRTGISGLAFLMSVVGLWGDGRPLLEAR